MLVSVPIDQERHRFLVISLAESARAAIERGDVVDALKYLALAHDFNYIRPGELPPLRHVEEEVRDRLK